MRDHDKLYINGAWVPSAGTGTIEVIDANTEEVMGHIPEGTADDVDRAVAGRQGGLRDLGLHRPRGAGQVHAAAIAEGLAARSAEIAEVISDEVGMPLHVRQHDPGRPARRQHGRLRRRSSTTSSSRRPIGNSLVVREPIGVVGAITPWNYPLHQIVAKVAPALAAGCTVVLKPSEVAPLDAFILAEIIDSVGLPAGVFNLVTGTGPVVGEAIAAHPDVDMVSFTGSTRAGKRVTELAAETVKRVALELGGKSANVILDDADLEAARRPPACSSAAT